MYVFFSILPGQIATLATASVQTPSVRHLLEVQPSGQSLEVALPSCGDVKQL